MNSKGPILLYDGVCILCNRLIIFIIKRDKQAKIRFTPLQSASGVSILAKAGLSIHDINSIVLVEDDKVFLKSSAILHIFKVLGGGWRLFSGLAIIPEFIRDFVYKVIAFHRYRIFGRREECMFPEADIKARFLV